ncbi:transglycosylase family protein [Streptomyces sp. JJ66]|uniref:LysM peptidoglycan-binding domain-containing protein n=1 Tax=Streptomyces sp. JJ66 TaxID=2803843 RepID=UPI001C55C5B0|nr:transglycosylase family protein [Streptomyces sp. JJ66]MBW1602754.1 transglycosylase family protein [Streptomyces sp. JJ66]
MRSGNGRHRRPRQAPAVVVTMGVTGAGVALPLLGASGAHAVDGTVWDRVAECESGGAWSANGGTGYYGGFQLPLDTWERYGGTAHADRPDLASRNQQIAVAEEILAQQGPDAWPTCAVTSGLTAAVNGVNASARTPDGAEGGELSDDATGAPQAPGAADEPAGEATGAPAGDADPGADQARPGAAPAAPESGGSGAGADPGGAADASGRPEAEERAAGERDGGGRHRGEPDAAKNPPGAGQRSDRSTGRHAAPADGIPFAEPRADDFTGTPGAGAGEPRHPANGDARRTEQTYTVESGDSLSGIAGSHQVPGGWPALYAANEEVVGADENLILPGQTLELPAAAH